MAIKSVFFDLDGTLWDCRACASYALGLALDRIEEQNGDGGWPCSRSTALNVALLDAVIEDGFMNLTPSAYTRRLDQLLNRYMTSDPGFARELGSRCHAARRFAARSFLKPDAHETIMQLKNRGIHVGVVTNGAPAIQRNTVELLGLKDVLDDVVMGEAEGYVKPDRRLFSLCIDRAGSAPEETLFVGDSFFTDILGAKRAGAGAVLICNRKIRIPTRIPPPDYALTNLRGLLKLV